MADIWFFGASKSDFRIADTHASNINYKVYLRTALLDILQLKKLKIQKLTISNYTQYFDLEPFKFKKVASFDLWMRGVRSADNSYRIVPTNPFTILEPQNLPIDEFNVVQKRRANGF